MMKCVIVQNEGICILLLVCISALSCSFVAESLQTIQELCSSNRYIYSLQPGETHQLKLTSVNSPGEINKWYQKSKRKCLKEFKTNNGASHFSIVVSNMSVPSCSEKCHCNYFEISEPGHKEKFCGVVGDDIYFESKSDYLSIEFQHGLSMRFEVTLTFTVQRNTYVIAGLSKENHSSGSFLETPYFPNLYQSDYISEYILQSDDLSGHVMLMFLDFQLAPESFVEVVGHNNTHPVRYFGDVFRPPVLVSEKHQLNLRFEANNQLASGFRAVCFFLRDSDVSVNKPFTGCGGAKDGFSGSVSIQSSASHYYYDCLWHLSTLVLPHTKSYFLSVSNITLENLGPKASLEFREGLNSKSKLVKSINCDISNCSIIPTEITIPAASGLYIRFNGLLNPDSVVRMIYSTYSNGNCSEHEIVCNERCLLPALRCDGIQNCPDGNDEQECTRTTALLTTPPPIMIKRKLHITNTAASFLVVLIFGICGLIVVVLVIIIAVYRHFKKDPSSQEHTAQPQIVNEMEETLPQTCPRISTYYDQPPSYDDFIRTSEQYPPLLFTRAARHSLSYPACFNIQHTTSFCGKEVLNHHSAIPSFDVHSLNYMYTDRDIVNEPPLFDEPSCSFGRSNTEWILKESIFKNNSCLKKSTSFDSILSKKTPDKNKCHFHVSITHSICPHACCHSARFHSLPTHFKINEFKPNEIGITFLTNLPERGCNKERKYSSCIVCDSSMKPEIVTRVKTRCYSDPCKGVSLYYSLYH